MKPTNEWFLREKRAFEWERRIHKKLIDAGFDVEEQPALGGLRPDFLVRRPDGSQIVVEAKAWKTTPANLERAAQQARWYGEQTKADGAVVVVEGAQHVNKEGVVAESDLVDFIRSVKFVGHSTREVARAKKAAKRVVFVAMPFDAVYDDVFFVAISKAAQRVGAAAIRVDQVDFIGDIPTKIRDLISTSHAVIADISEARANVMYEVGFAHAIQIPCVHICSTPLKKLPFDVSHFNTLEYSRGQTHKLVPMLSRRLRAAIKP